MHRTRATLVAVLVLSAAITDAKAPTPSGRSRGATTSEPRYSVLEDPSAYGLAPGRGIANAQVVLERRRDTRNSKDLAGPAGEIVAKAVSGAGGGVTFENVPPGQYVVTFTVAHAVSQQVATRTGEIPLPRDLFRYRMKSFFEHHSNAEPMTISGQQWSSFTNVPYVYAVRAASLTNEAAEVRTDGHSTVIAQQFVVPDGSPAAVQAAVGHKFDHKC